MSDLRALASGWLDAARPAIVVRVAIWVRFGPITPTIIGLPLMP